MRITYESDLQGAEKLAFGGLCDAVGQLVAMVFDDQTGASKREIRRHIEAGTGQIRLRILTDPVSVKVTLHIGRNQDRVLYEVHGTPDGADHCLAPRRGRPILPVGLQKRYREQP